MKTIDLKISEIKPYEKTRERTTSRLIRLQTA